MINCEKLYLEDGKLNREGQENHSQKCSYIIIQDAIKRKSINCLSNSKNRYILQNAYIEMSLQLQLYQKMKIKDRCSYISTKLHLFQSYRFSRMLCLLYLYLYRATIVIELCLKTFEADAAIYFIITRNNFAFIRRLHIL